MCKEDEYQVMLRKVIGNASAVFRMNVIKYKKCRLCVHEFILIYYSICICTASIANVLVYGRSRKKVCINELFYGCIPHGMI